MTNLPSIAALTAGAVLVVLQIAVCLLTADFLAGLLHWIEDTFLVPGKNELLDRLVVGPNIDHHKKPGGIREGTYWEVNCVTIGIAVVATVAMVLLRVHAWEVYLTILIASQSNQIHAWGHTSNPPGLVGRLQRAGILQSARYHAVHHKAPYGVRYCTTTPLLNPVLDHTGFWRALEWSLARCGATVQRASAARGGY